MYKRQLFELLQRKAESDIQQFSLSVGIDQQNKHILSQLCSLNGDETVLARAETLLEGYGEAIFETISTLREIGRALYSAQGGAVVHYDLAELRGYQYHNGVVFAAYVPGSGAEIARGGRYDGIGAVFGSSRAATGYSTDLKALMNLIEPQLSIESTGGILAPLHGSDKSADENLKATVLALRAKGEIVVTQLGEDKAPQCDRILKEHNGSWLLENR